MRLQASAKSTRRDWKAGRKAGRLPASSALPEMFSSSRLKQEEMASGMAVRWQDLRDRKESDLLT